MSLKTLSSLSKERIIVVVCIDTRNYFRVTNVLKSHGIKFTSLTEDKLSPMLDVVISDLELKEFKRSRIVTLKRELMESPILLLEVCRAILDKERLDQVILGIDLGKETGIVLVSDGILVLTKVVHEIVQVVSMIEEIVKLINFREFIIKIGRSPNTQNMLYRLLKLLPKDERIKVKLVDESRVSELFKLYSKILKEKNDNIVAAYAICLTRDCPHF